MSNQFKTTKFFDADFSDKKINTNLYDRRYLDTKKFSMNISDKLNKLFKGLQYNENINMEIESE